MGLSWSYLVDGWSAVTQLTCIVLFCFGLVQVTIIYTKEAFYEDIKMYLFVIARRCINIICHHLSLVIYHFNFWNPLFDITSIHRVNLNISDSIPTVKAFCKNKETNEQETRKWQYNFLTRFKTTIVDVLYTAGVENMTAFQMRQNQGG